MRIIVTAITAIDRMSCPLFGPLDNKKQGDLRKIAGTDIAALPFVWQITGVKRWCFSHLLSIFLLLSML